MSVQLGRIGAWRFGRDLHEAFAVEVEKLGYGALWVGGSPSGDLELVERLLDATSTIGVATGIVNIWQVEAASLAASYHRLAERHPGRFLLGVGVGHPEQPVPYQRPYSALVTYLDELDRAGVPVEERALAALGPKVLRLAAERTAGAHPYLTTPAHTAWAREVLGSGPLLAPEQKVVLESDPDRARAVGRSAVERYLGLVNYATNLRRTGYTDEDLANGGSDRLIYDLAVHGDAATVARGVTAHLDAGADHVCVQMLGDDPLAGFRELAGALPVRL